MLSGTAFSYMSASDTVNGVTFDIGLLVRLGEKFRIAAIGYDLGPARDSLTAQDPMVAAKKAIVDMHKAGATVIVLLSQLGKVESEDLVTAGEAQHLARVLGVDNRVDESARRGVARVELVLVVGAHLFDNLVGQSHKRIQILVLHVSDRGKGLIEREDAGAPAHQPVHFHTIAIPAAKRRREGDDDEALPHHACG